MPCRTARSPEALHAVADYSDADTRQTPHQRPPNHRRRLAPGHAEASSMATAELTMLPETSEQLLFVIDLDQRFLPLLLAYGHHFTTDAHTYSGRRYEPKACFDNCGSIMVSYPERNLRYAEGYAVLANA